MQAISTQKLPHSLYGIQVRTVGWQKVEQEMLGMIFPPLLVKFGMMITGIVRDQYHFAPCRVAFFKKQLHIVVKAFGIKLLGLPLVHKHAIPQPHSSKIPHAFSARKMSKDRVFDLRRDPHQTSRPVLLEMDLIQRPEIDPLITAQDSEFFLNSSCFSGSALAITGLGFLIRNPNWRKRRWHCLTPKLIPYLDSINLDKVLPSQRLVSNPTSKGDCRRTSPISQYCSSLSREGRPGRSKSTSPESPSSSNRWTQYSTVRGASPSNLPTCGQLIPWATRSTAWSRWSYRESRERRISSWRPRIMRSASAIFSFFMRPG